jgi:hypothetical protein
MLSSAYEICMSNTHCDCNAQYCRGEYEEYPGQIFTLNRISPWNAKTCEAAALNGHLDVLQWARENGCNWNENAFISAAEGGHIHICKYTYYGAIAIFNDVTLSFIS